jgi:hypothetical protein
VRRVERMTQALNRTYSNPKFVCAQFSGAEKPSLLCPNSSPFLGIEQLESYHRASLELLLPQAETQR